MKKILNFGKILQRDFSLCKPVRIDIKDNLRWVKNGSECFAIYYGREHSHKIVLHKGILQCDIMLFATMAHEYVHAWQNEHGYIKLSHSKEEFPEWVKHFRDKYNIDIINMSLV